MVAAMTPKQNHLFAALPAEIFEVSKSTKKMDTTTKLIHYINLPTLKEYVLVEQDSVCVQVLRKRNYWQSEYFYLSDNVTFESIGLSLTVEEIYDRVDNDDMNEPGGRMLKLFHARSLTRPCMAM